MLYLCRSTKKKGKTSKAPPFHKVWPAFHCKPDRQQFRQLRYSLPGDLLGLE
ncbi:hypothetical protein THIOM_003844 [Candidatus Thiomargarita nelsonii]|uniref:Uncharacterized protein n=1 Tax=Candidatus Thiomargarita nelsonii TaxID=1003181 RepID=A0A176RXD0_9GAMM|nr:hypothetical protein THIOM_003844 [Candidatus Thiomargarita nelsonii]